MQKKLTLHSEEILYTVRRHRRARHLRLTVNCDAQVFITVPRWLALSEAERFMRQKAEWILEKVKQFKKVSGLHSCGGTRQHYLENHAAARAKVFEKVTEHNLRYGFAYKKISIRNQRTRWGSCSRQGNLNFNYKLLFLPEHLADYVIVHELCHLRELNHSIRFWKLVAEAIPDYHRHRAELRRQRFS